VPARAWQKLGTDIFEYKSKSYLVIVDYYSKFLEISLLKDKSSQAVITSMKSVFARHGIPDEVVADNMPFSSKECLQFAQEWGFKISTSSPHYPQSNGMSERTIQTIKNLLRKADDEGNDPYIALLEYRNTPITGMQEWPAQLIMSRMLKSKLPTTTALLQPKVQENVREKLEQRAEKQKEYFDRNAKSMRPVKMYQSARIRRGKVWEPAVITGTHKVPRSFIVTTPQGEVYRRNRRHLLPTSEPPVSLTI
jgi:transposase InsO family protein